MLHLARRFFFTNEENVTKFIYNNINTRGEKKVNVYLACASISKLAEKKINKENILLFYFLPYVSL